MKLTLRRIIADPKGIVMDSVPHEIEMTEIYRVEPALQPDGVYGPCVNVLTRGGEHMLCLGSMHDFMMD